ncbi:MAG: hypothetical protein ABR974_00940 [Bacteroidales bacterium]|jgi:hypothetical protein
MTKKSKKIDKQTSAIKNEEVNNVDVYEPDAEDFYEPDESDIYEPDDDDKASEYEYLYNEQVYYNLECQLTDEERLDNKIADNAIIEANLRKIAYPITEMIGEGSYIYLMLMVLSEGAKLKYAKSHNMTLADVYTPLYRISSEIGSKHEVS